MPSGLQRGVGATGPGGPAQGGREPGGLGPLLLSARRDRRLEPHLRAAGILPVPVRAAARGLEARARPDAAGDLGGGARLVPVGSQALRPGRDLSFMPMLIRLSKMGIPL